MLKINTATKIKYTSAKKVTTERTVIPVSNPNIVHCYDVSDLGESDVKAFIELSKDYGEYLKTTNKFNFVDWCEHTGCKLPNIKQRCFTLANIEYPE